MEHLHKCRRGLANVRSALVVAIAAVEVAGIIASATPQPAAGQTAKKSVSTSLGAANRAGEWPQWRGVNRDGPNLTAYRLGDR